jgi:hypothetical protein
MHICIIINIQHLLIHEIVSTIVRAYSNMTYKVCLKSHVEKKKDPFFFKLTIKVIFL